jgi:8-oxo-dGTP pyrophosphatase MutT (NUDIX family)
MNHHTHPSPAQTGAVVLLRDDGAALMQHRDDKPGLNLAGMWVPPGGHCEPGESLEACAQREFLEETGYRCGQLHWLASYEEGLVDGWPARQVTIFWARYDGVQELYCLEGQAISFLEREQAVAYPIPVHLVEIWDRAIAAAAGDPATRSTMERNG